MSCSFQVEELRDSIAELRRRDEERAQQVERISNALCGTNLSHIPSFLTCVLVVPLLYFQGTISEVLRETKNEKEEEKNYENKTTPPGRGAAREKTSPRLRNETADFNDGPSCSKKMAESSPRERVSCIYF